jgi:hypothetical protein
MTPMLPRDARHGMSTACRPACAIVQASAHVSPWRAVAAADHDGAVFLAHAAHWLAPLAYFAPVVAIAFGLIATQLRERRRARGADCRNAQPESAPSALP